MTDTYARMRQLVGSTADWSANDIVIGDGEIAVERAGATIKIKIGNGTDKFSVLPYVSDGGNTISSTVQSALDSKLALTGGTMTGPLVLSGTPSATNGATTKGYVDTAVSGVQTAANGKVSKAGDTMTGFLILAGPPTATNGAVTKGYVDTAVSGVQTATNGKVSKAGDTMTGFLTLAGPPTTTNQAATKDYVDTGDAKSLQKVDAVAVSTGAASANKPVLTNSAGYIDASMLNVLPKYLGSADITQAYVAPTPLHNSDYYTVGKDGTTSPSWRAVIDGAPHSLTAGATLRWDGTWWHASGGGATVGDIDVGTF